MKDNFIKNYWDNNALIYRGSHEASWGDIYAINLEIETIGKYIKNGDDVLDIGCANGYSSIQQWQNKRLNSLVGIDYSGNMIHYANLNKKQFNLDNANLNFNVGDIREICYPENTFDVTYTTRVLINLPSWEEQKKAILECIRVTKKGGKVIFSEGFWEPLVLLNAIRKLVNLEPLAEHDFNRYIKQNYLEKFLDDLKLQYKREDFSSVYYLGSRFLRELVTKVDDYEGYSNPINEQFYNLEKVYSGGNFGIQQAYVITKE